MANVYIFGDITAASRLTWDCYKSLYSERQELDYEYRQFQDSVEKVRLGLQKLELDLLSDMTHAHFGSVSDDFESVWQTLTDSVASSPSCVNNFEVEDPFAPFVWPEDVDCTKSYNCNCDHYREKHGYVDRHALPFSFNNGRFHRPGLGLGTTCSNINIPTTSLDSHVLDTDLEAGVDMITKMDGNKGGTALWPTSSNMTTCPNCHRDDDDDIDDRHV